VSKKKLPGSDAQVGREIRHRISRLDDFDRLDRKTKTDLIERNREFVSINILEDKLHVRLKNLAKAKQKIFDEEIEIQTKLRDVKKRRKNLGYEHEVIVTDHAMLRYLERYMDIDMNETYVKILKLPKSDLTKFGNTVVTVYPVHHNRTVTKEENEVE
jgi:hypothetical protein